MAQVQERVINGLFDLRRVKQFLQQADTTTNITNAIADIDAAIVDLVAQEALED